jgi:hypothetical protein
MHHRFCFSWIVTVVGLSAGCASTARNIARQAAPPAVDSALKSLSDPPNQKSLTDLVNSPAVTSGTMHLGRGMGRGFTEEALADIGLTTSTTLPATTLPTEPAVTGELHHLLRQLIDIALGSDSQRDARDMAAAVGEGTVRGVSRGMRDQLAPEIAREIKEQIGPAIAATIKDQIAPAIADVMSRDVAGSLRQSSGQVFQGLVDVLHSSTANQTAHDLIKSGSLGVNDATVAIGHPDPITAMSIAISRMTWIIVGLLVVAGFQIVAIFAALGMIYFSKRNRN